MTEQAIYEALRGHAGLSALVAGRVYPLVMPQDVILPAVSFFRVSGGQVNSLSGYSGLENPRIQVDAWGRSYLESKNVAAQIRQAMSESAAFTSTIISDQDLHEEDFGIFRVSIDFSVWANT